MELYQHLHAMVKILRDSKGWTIQDVADELGSSYYHVASSISKSTRVLPIWSIEHLADISSYPEREALKRCWLEHRLLSGRQKYIWSWLLPDIMALKPSDRRRIMDRLYDSERAAAVARKA